MSVVRKAIRYLGPVAVPLPRTVTGPGDLADGALFDLPEGGLLTIGRRAGNDIVVRSNVVAGAHAMVCRPRNISVLVVDLGTTTGTRVQGAHGPVSFLKPGQEIVIGGWFRFRLEVAPDSSP